MPGVFGTKVTLTAFLDLGLHWQEWHFIADLIELAELVELEGASDRAGVPPRLKMNEPVGELGAVEVVLDRDGEENRGAGLMANALDANDEVSERAVLFMRKADGDDGSPTEDIEDAFEALEALDDRDEVDDPELEDDREVMDAEDDPDEKEETDVTDAGEARYGDGFGMAGYSTVFADHRRDVSGDLPWLHEALETDEASDPALMPRPFVKSLGKSR